MTKTQQVYRTIKTKPMTKAQLSEVTKLTLTQVTSAIDRMLAKGQVHYTKDERSKKLVYFATKKGDEQKIAIQNYGQFMKTARSVFPHREMNVVYKEQPFSTNEMDYGRDGKKWNWEDVIKEAIAIDYFDASTKNHLPFYLVEE